jgi:hypothetical protein
MVCVLAMLRTEPTGTGDLGESLGSRRVQQDDARRQVGLDLNFGPRLWLSSGRVRAPADGATGWVDAVVLAGGNSLDWERTPFRLGIQPQR